MSLYSFGSQFLCSDPSCECCQDGTTAYSAIEQEALWSKREAERREVVAQQEASSLTGDVEFLEAEVERLESMLEDMREDKEDLRAVNAGYRAYMEDLQKANAGLAIEHEAALTAVRLAAPVVGAEAGVCRAFYCPEDMEHVRTNRAWDAIQAVLQLPDPT